VLQATALKYIRNKAAPAISWARPEHERINYKYLIETAATEGIIFYLTTRIAASLGQFRKTAGIASFTALPLCFKRSPHPFNSK